MTESQLAQISDEVSNLKEVAIRTLTLTNYRNHKRFRLEIAPGPILVIGDNGVGKTNILEAISHLSPGRGLRGSKLSDISNFENPNSSWGISTLVEVGKYNHEIGVSIDERLKKICSIDGERFTSQTILGKYFSVIWQSPLMDQLFVGPAFGRRKFLSRLVFNFFPNHASDLSRYEYCQSERLNILRNKPHENEWLSTLEQKMAESAVAIAACRLEAIIHLQQEMHNIEEPFPKALLEIKGDVESMMQNFSALEVEDKFKQILKENRNLDRETNRSNAGVHKSDLLVYHGINGTLAEHCSTGEQKALLTSIILAEVRAKISWHRVTPILLFDEPATHLDIDRRQALYELILSMNVQTWMTGTDKELFSFFEGKANFVDILDNK
jgi:DNA replication and repair protein RecF